MERVFACLAEAGYPCQVRPATGVRAASAGGAVNIKPSPASMDDLRLIHRAYVLCTSEGKEPRTWENYLAEWVRLNGEPPWLTEGWIDDTGD